MHQLLHCDLLKMSLFKFSRVPVRYFGMFGPKLMQNKSVNEQPKDFVTIYKFPYIRAFSVVNKLKMYQSFLTAISVPGTIILNQMGITSVDNIHATIIIGITGCMVLHTFGYFCMKFIGFIYVNKEENIAKVSYVDFWGNRCDKIIPVNDIVPLSDSPVSLTDGIYSKLRRYSSKDILKFNSKYGIILDKEKFNKMLM